MIRKATIVVLLMVAGWMFWVAVASFGRPSCHTILDRESRYVFVEIRNARLLCYVLRPLPQARFRGLVRPLPQARFRGFARAFQAEYRGDSYSYTGIDETWFNTKQYIKSVRAGGTFHAEEVFLVVLALWIPLSLLLAYPAVTIVRRALQRRHRRRMGYCLRCGYNLTGLIDPLCPECGQTFDPVRQREARLKLRFWIQGAARWRARYATCRVRKATAALLLAATLASFAFWGGSYFRIAYHTPSWACRIAWGNFIFYWRSTPAVHAEADHGWHLAGYQGLVTDWWVYPFLKSGGTALYIPLWIPTLVLALLWALSYRPVYRLSWHRRGRGRCINCAYDLTGNVSGRCPECGEAT